MERLEKIRHQAGMIKRLRADAGAFHSGRLFGLYVEDQLKFGGDLDALEVRLDSELQAPGSFVPERLHWCESVGIDEFGIFAHVSVKNVGFKMRHIPAGSCMMGSPENEEGREDHELPPHEVVLTRSFWLCDAPCTQVLWKAVMGSNPSHFQGPDLPVETVSWNDSQAFLQKLNALISALGSRLPTGAQWEWACRAGTTGPRYGPIDRIAWYEDNSEEQTHPVGRKEPNAFGLYDMLGNVSELSGDGLRNQGRGETVYDPVGDLREDNLGIIRGGSYSFNAPSVRAASYDWIGTAPAAPIIGFRFARDQ